MFGKFMFAKVHREQQGWRSRKEKRKRLGRIPHFAGFAGHFRDFGFDSW